MFVIPSETLHADVVFFFVFPETAVQLAADIMSVLFVKRMQNEILKI